MRILILGAGVGGQVVANAVFRTVVGTILANLPLTAERSFILTR